MALPAEIEASLCRCGGIDGLVERLPTEAAIEAACAVHRALADPFRQKILAMLTVQPLCVCVIKAVLAIADSKLSYHLSVLKKAGLIQGEQQGNWIIYRLTDEGERWAPVSDPPLNRALVQGYRNPAEEEGEPDQGGEVHKERE